MEKTIKGTSVSLLYQWILDMEEEIKKSTFYCVPTGEYLTVNPLNRARLHILYQIFPIGSNENVEGSSKHLSAHRGGLLIAHPTMLAYFKTMKTLIGKS